MERKDLDKQSIICIIEVGIIIVSLLFLLVYHYESIANYFYGSSVENKGKLLATLLTAIGGICVVWGLYLNNKKVNQQIRQVNEQVRQNNISVQNSNDKRFGEAIGYLSNKRESIVLGGIYTLFQLAKEDEKYAEIIYNVFSKCLKEYSNNIELNTELTDIIFFQQPCPFSFIKSLEQEYYFKNIVFNNAYFRNFPKYTIFQDCIFNSGTVIDGYFIEFRSCNIKFLKVKNCAFLHIIKGDVDYISISGRPVCIDIAPMNLDEADISCREVSTINIAPFMLTKSVKIHNGIIKTLNIEDFHTSDPTAKVYISSKCEIGSKSTETDYWIITDQC